MWCVLRFTYVRHIQEEYSMKDPNDRLTQDMFGAMDQWSDKSKDSEIAERVSFRGDVNSQKLVPLPVPVFPL